MNGSPINQQPVFGAPNQGPQNLRANRLEARRPAPLDLNGLRMNLEEDVFSPRGIATPAAKEKPAPQTPAK